jgi:hypothetical protein
VVVDLSSTPEAFPAFVGHSALREVDRAVGGDVAIEGNTYWPESMILVWLQTPASCDWAIHGSPPSGR